MAPSTGIATTMKGSLLGVILNDICEEIRDWTNCAKSWAQSGLSPASNMPLPSTFALKSRPVVESLEPVLLSSGECLRLQLKYYDYGVVSVILELGFEADWDELVKLAARWVPSPELERQPQQIVRGRLERISPAVVRLYNEWLSEDYYIFLLSDVPGRPSGAELLAEHGLAIAQMLRGEETTLAPGEIQEVLQANLSYYPNDLVVVGWNAALVYDGPSGAETSVQILEYANSQLLEFRAL